MSGTQETSSTQVAALTTTQVGNLSTDKAEHPALNPLRRLEEFIVHIPAELQAEFAALAAKIKSHF